VSYGIQPGDRVDIIVSLLYVDLDEEFQSILPNTVNIVNVSQPEPNNFQVTFGEEIDGRFESESVPGAGTVPVIVRPSEDPRPRLVVQRTIQNADVLYIGNFPVDGVIFEAAASPTPASIDVDEVANQNLQDGEEPVDTGLSIVVRDNIVTLAVTPQESLIITWLIEARVPLTFAMRAATDNSRVITDPVTLEYIMDTYEIAVPPSRNYSIEPAIRSIRQLLTENVVALSGQTASVEQE